MKVYSAKWFSGVFLAMGVVLLLLGVWVASLQGAFNGQIVLGALFLLIGILYLRVPVFAVEADNIALYRPLGSVKQRFPFKARSEIRIDRDKLFVGSAQVPVQKWILDRTQWQAFESSISS